MATKTVLHHPNQQLRKHSAPCTKDEILHEDMQAFVNDMIDTMKIENGVGLAAPQVDKHIRLIICETDNGPEAYFNPEIIKVSTGMRDSEEGCLSVPNVYGVVRRHKQVKVQALNRHGEPVSIKARGLLSVIFQHEIDHLDGVLFIDRAHKIHDLTKEKEREIL